MVCEPVINGMERRVAPDVISALSAVPTTIIGDVFGRLSGMIGLSRFDRNGGRAGSALTVRVRPGDNLYLHKALQMALPGDILVVDGAGDANNALIGEIMMRQAAMRGIAGFVIDGAVRDVRAFREGSLLCYARGHSLRGPFKLGPGEINTPIVAAGTSVNPGDVIVADDDGVVVIPANDAAATLAAARIRMAEEEQFLADIACGCEDNAWIEKMINAKASR
jgi:regulator of RNase E activity RraA